MRRHWMISVILALALVGGVVVVPAPASTRQVGGFDVERKDYVVSTKFGDIFVHVAHAAKDGKIVKAPAIFTYSPYSLLGGPPNYRRAFDAERWVPNGYHRVWADVVGTGNSGGCWDYGGDAEIKSGADIVEWIAKQKWSTGKVGMIGGSYEGTTATAVATADPKGLATIVPEAGISRWYEYAFSGGIRYFWNDEAIGPQGPGSIADEGFDTPLAFDFGLAIPPPLDVGGENWADRVESTIRPCQEIEHTQRAYDDTPDYDKFWLERDYIKDAGNIDVPALIAHNWGDWNVKQEEAWNLFNALDNSPKKVLYMGTRWEGHDTPGGKYDKRVEAWMDHYLKGIDNGIENLPEIVSQVANQDADGKWYEGSRPKTHNVTLYAQETPLTQPGDYPWKILPTKPQPNPFGEPTPARFPGVDTQELHANGHPRNNHEWLWFESPALGRDVRVFGEIKVQIWSTVQRKWVTFTPVVVDMDPKKMVMVNGIHVGYTDPVGHLSVTRGFLDSRYRDGLSKQKDIKPGVPLGMTVGLKPVDYIFKKGHFLGLNIMTGLQEWNVPKAPSCEAPGCENVILNLEDAKTRLILPVVGKGDARSLFSSGGHDHG